MGAFPNVNKVIYLIKIYSGMYFLFLSGSEDVVQLRENEISERNDTAAKLGGGKGKTCCNFSTFWVWCRDGEGMIKLYLLLFVAYF